MKKIKSRALKSLLAVSLAGILGLGMSSLTLTAGGCEWVCLNGSRGSSSAPCFTGACSADSFAFCGGPALISCY
ncbi:MAG: hypothetical protein QNK37_23790 [Acidobacteriota bacterium]|nr:hypothetical protein [Acidobacteriota bacterium]